MKRILITGGHGFIGRHLAIALTSSDTNITTVDVKKPQPGDDLVWDTEMKDVRVFMKELENQRQLSNLYGEPEPFDFIFHLAATPRVGISLEHPELVLRNNIDTLIDVLGYCRHHPKTKLIFISSSSVIWTDIDRNPYALSKHIGEELVSTYAATFGITATVTRLFNVYGPGEAEYGSSTTLIRQCKKALWKSTPIIVHGDGTQIRDFTHVDDICRGLICVMKELDAGDYKNIYEIGMADGSVSVNDVVNAFASGEDVSIHHAPARQDDPPMTKADCRFWPKHWHPSINVIDYINEWKNDGYPLD